MSDETNNPTPDEEDAYIDSPASGGYSWRIANTHGGTRYGDAESCVAALASYMESESYSPNVWMVNERGNTELLRLSPFAADTGEYEHAGISYV